MRKLVKKPILDRVFLVGFGSQYEVAATFLRFQEHYESPRFRRKIFSLEQYMDWYAAEYGNFTYFEDWSGFNVPSWVLRPFYAGRFDPLLDKERRLLDLLRDLDGDFYVIGIARDGDGLDRDTLEHEIAHGLYHTDAGYRRQVRACLREHDTTSLQQRLLEQGYDRRVLLDEVHAYVLTDLGEQVGERRRHGRLQRRLRAIFAAHGGEEATARALSG